MATPNGPSSPKAVNGSPKRYSDDSGTSSRRESLVARRRKSSRNSLLGVAPEEMAISSPQISLPDNNVPQVV